MNPIKGITNKRDWVNVENNEEKIPTKTRVKEWAFVIGVIVVVTVASIIAYNYGLNQGKDTKEETPTTQTGDSEPTQNDIVSI